MENQDRSLRCWRKSKYAFRCSMIASPRLRISLLVWLSEFQSVLELVTDGTRFFSIRKSTSIARPPRSMKRNTISHSWKVWDTRYHWSPKQRLVSPNRRKNSFWCSSVVRNFWQWRLVLLHPGSGSSARDWKPERFAQLAVELTKLGYQVVITGGKTEEALVHRVAHEAENGVKPFISTLNLKEFAAFIQTAKLFVANSTGSIAHCCCSRNSGDRILSTVRVMSPKRWGPLTDKKAIFIPDPVRCPRCKGGECKGTMYGSNYSTSGFRSCGKVDSW